MSQSSSLDARLPSLSRPSLFEPNLEVQSVSCGTVYVDLSTFSRRYFYSAEISIFDYVLRMNEGWHKRLCDAIDSALANKKLSGSDFERRTGKNRNMMHDILGGVVPKVDNFLLVCDYISADPVEILTGTPQGSQAAKILRAVDRLDPAQQEHFLAILASIPTQSPEEPQARYSLPSD